jgi:hypothetical protein
LSSWQTIGALLVLVGLTLLAGLSNRNWSPSPNSASASEACTEPDSLRCKVCQALDGDDCRPKPQAGCPVTTAEFSSKFPQFRAKLEERKSVVKGWTTFKQQMDSILNRNAIELCQRHVVRMTKIESEIPTAENCSGDTAVLLNSKEPTVLVGVEVTELMQFRDCAELKANEIAIQIKQRTSVGGETAQLHSLMRGIMKINTDAIFFLTEFRELAKEAIQTKCWLRARIRDCRL